MEQEITDKHYPEYRPEGAGPNGQVERLVRILRKKLSLTPAQATDVQILAGTKGTILRIGAEIEIAKEDFYMAATPLVYKISKQINDAFTRIGKFRF